MTTGVAVYGAGGHARVVASILHRNRVSLLGFFDDAYHGPEKIQGVAVMGKFHDVLSYQESISSVYLAIGHNLRRKQAFEFLDKNGFDLPFLVHPSAQVENDSRVGSGAVICTGAIVGTEAVIGEGAIINTGCIIDHESRVGAFVHMAPGSVIAGRTIIGNNTFIGMNVSVADGIKIGSDVTIGAGSIVLKDVPDEAKILGVHH